MISSKENEVSEKLKQKYNLERAPNMKYKKNGTLDMRYKENIKLFSEEYKKMMLTDNRKHNNIYRGPIECYRQDIIDMTEKELVEYSLKKN